MRRFLPALLALSLLLAGCASTVPEPGDDPAGGTAVPDADLTVTVLRVVDGDTLKVRLENGSEDTVRLVGVDTPEVHADTEPDEFEGVPATEAGRSCLRRWGETASAFAKDRLAGEAVGLAFDPNLDRRGYYGRLLAYVVHEEETVNYRLVADGYGRVYDSQFSRRDVYDAAESRAREQGTGLWECATESPPTGTTSASRTATDGAGTGDLGVSVHPNAEGDDNENLNDEYVTLHNRGDDPLSLDGWTVSDEAGKTYEFGAVTLDADATVTLHTGSGNDTATDVYWGRTGAVWNNDGDVITVRTANGTLVVRERY